MIKQFERALCSRQPQGLANVRGMKRLNVTHPSALRLLDAARTLHPKRFTGAGHWSDLARLLNESDQTVNNWRSRGVPKTRVHGLSEKIGCNWKWVLAGDGQMAASPPQALESKNPPVPAQTEQETGKTYSPEALGMAMRWVREIEERGRGRLPHEEFVRLTLAVADWVASLDRTMNDEDERRFSDMLVKLVTGMLKPLNNL